jgi:hypothetical protein
MNYIDMYKGKIVINLMNECKTSVEDIAVTLQKQLHNTLESWPSLCQF